MTASIPASIDLRSDTVTRPTLAMRRAMAEAEVGDDVLEGDPTTKRLEAEVAERLGKEAALFFPTGTMANQAAIWLQTQPGTEMLVDADAHIVHWELAATAALAGVQIRPVRGPGSVMRAPDLAATIRPPSPHAAECSLVCLENTHNGAGGAVTPIDALQALHDVARANGLRIHLDGARLWNASAATGTSLADFAACADTVMVSFSKGLGAPVGAVLAGPRELMARGVRVRKRLGGGLRQSGVLAAGALHGLHTHLDRLTDDHAAARVLAERIDGAGGAKVVMPDTNIVMIDLPTPATPAVVARAAELGVRISPWSASRVRAVCHLDAPMAVMETAAARLRQALETAG